MKELLAISGDEWIEIDRKNHIANESCYVVVDGDIIPEDLDGAFKDAARSGVQLVIGSNNDEWNYFMEDSGGETAKEKFKSWVDDMDSTYNDACNHAGEKGKPALEELLEYEAGIVPKEYAGDENVRVALAKSGSYRSCGDTRFWTLPTGSRMRERIPAHTCGRSRRPETTCSRARSTPSSWPMCSTT